MSTTTDHRAPDQRSPLAEILAVGLPSAATMLSYPLMQLVDSRMVSELGPVAVAAQGNGGLAVWVIGSFVVGAMTIVNTYVSQNLGAGRLKRTSAYAWNGLWVCAFASIFTTLMIPFAGAYFSLFPHEPELVRLETAYAQVTLAGAFFMMAARTIHQFFYGVHKSSVVLATAIISHVANVVFNYVFIFGKFGFPELGVAGAALGTVLATVIEFALPMALFLSPRYARVYATRETWRLSGPRVRELLRIGWPAGLQSGNEMLCWKLFVLGLVGSFGAMHAAASWFALRYMMLSFMPAVGIAYGITAVVGRWIGAGNRAEAQRRAVVGVVLTVGYMAVCGVLMVVFREPLIRVFLSSEYTPEEAAEAIRIGSMIMICAAVFQVFDALGIAMTGALRGAGDTIIPGVLNAIFAWAFLLAGGWFIATRYPQLGSLGPWIGAAAFIIALGAALTWRWSSGAWKRIDLDRPGAPAEAAPEASRGVEPEAALAADAAPAPTSPSAGPA